MENAVVDLTKSIWHQGNFFVIGILLFAVNGACDGYGMQDFCGKFFVFLWKEKYQIKLGLDDNRIYDTDTSNDFFPYQRTEYCETKFEAWSKTFSKLMFYFEKLDIDCDDGHLEIYTGENSNTRVSGLEGDICGDDKPKCVFTVDDRYFRIKYVPKRSQNISDIFSIIITIYGDGYCPRYAYECGNSRCIDGALVNNGNDSCGDGSDCDHNNTGAIVGIVIGCVVGLCLIISVVICCFCCTRRNARTPETVQSTVIPAVAYSGPNQQVNNQPLYGDNQGAPQYPISTAPSVAAPVSGHHDYRQPMYGFNQGANYPNNQAYYPTVSQNSQIDQQPTDQKQYDDPPPKYSDIFPNTEQGTNPHNH